MRHKNNSYKYSTFNSKYLKHERKPNIIIFFLFETKRIERERTFLIFVLIVYFALLCVDKICI